MQVWFFEQVMKFNDSEERDSFVMRLKTYFQSGGVAYIESEVSYSQLMTQANTKEMRDELLQRFFKTALAAVSFKNDSTFYLFIYLFINFLFFYLNNIFVFFLLPRQVREISGTGVWDWTFYRIS